MQHKLVPKPVCINRCAKRSLIKLVNRYFSVAKRLGAFMLVLQDKMNMTIEVSTCIFHVNLIAGGASKLSYKT